jgi:hypothetical protein
MVKEVDLRAGEDLKHLFFIRNTGILRDTYRVGVNSPIDVGWLGERTVQLEPGEDEEFTLHLHTKEAGTITVNVLVEALGTHETKELSSVLHVSRQGAVEQVLGGLAPLLGLKDLAEIVIITVSLVFAGRRYLQYRQNLDAMSRHTQTLNRMQTTSMHGGGQAYANRRY